MAHTHATTELVARAWAAQVPGIPGVADKLPTDNTSWAASGFLVVVPAGGVSNPYYRFAHSVAVFQGWSCNVDSPTPPWWKASNLIEALRHETLAHRARLVVLPNCAENAVVKQTQFVGEPRKVLGDLGDYAAYSQDIRLHWVPVAK